MKLALMFLINLTTWRFIFGWNGSDLIAGHDAIQELLIYKEVLRVGGDWTQLIYNLNIFGGLAYHGSYGTSFLNQIFAFLSLSPIAAYNSSLLVLQTVFCFLLTESAWGLAHLFTGTKVSFRWDIYFCTILILSFNCVLGWRFGWGQQNFISGALPLASFLYLIGRREFTLLGFLVSIFAFLQGFSGSGQQILLYSFFFLGVPILFLALKSTKRRIVIAGGIAFGSALLILPRNLEMLRLVFNHDLARHSGVDTIYSYMTGSWKDLFSMFFFDPAFLSGQSDSFFWHESNHSIGPILFGLLLIPWQKNKKFIYALSICFIGLTFFALDIKPISNFIAQLPGLGVFRVPSRGYMPFALFLSVLACSAIISKFKFNSKKRDRLAMILFFALGAFQVHAFQMRLLQGPNSKKIEEEPGRIGNALREKSNSPLERWSIEPYSGIFDANSGWALSVSVLDGYFPAPPNLIRLVNGVSHEDLRSSANNLHFRSDDKSFPAFQQLYNVRYHANLRSFPPEVTMLRSPPGGIWFGTNLRSTSFDEIIRNVTLQFPNWLQVLDETGQNVEENSSCLQAKILDTQVNQSGGDLVNVSYSSPAECPIVFSMNHSHTMQGNLNGNRKIELFTAFGSLTGAVLPAGQNTFTITCPSYLTQETRLLFYLLGALTLILAFYFQATTVRGEVP